MALCDLPWIPVKKTWRLNERHYGALQGLDKAETLNKYGEEKFVDLNDLWKERSTRIDSEFSRVLVAARTEIDKGKTVLIDQFMAFMGREFDTKFNELIDSLKEKMKDRDVRKQALDEARELLTWINQFKEKLDNTLAV